MSLADVSCACSSLADGLRTWPKGRVDPGETIEQAAVREVREESGVIAAVRSELPVVKTKKADRHYFLMHLVEDTGQYDHNETLQVRWVPFAAAKTLLTRERDLTVLNAAAKAVRNG